MNERKINGKENKRRQKIREKKKKIIFFRSVWYIMKERKCLILDNYHFIHVFNY